MNTDKNTVIGFVLLGVLFFVYFWYTNKQASEWQAIQQKQQDSVRKAQAKLRIPADPTLARLDSLRRDSASRLTAAGNFAANALATEQEVVLENELVKVTLTSKGGQVKKVELKKYSTTEGKPVILGEQNAIAYSVNTAPNVAASSSQLNFVATPVATTAAGGQSVTFELKDSSGKSLSHQFTLEKNVYHVDWKIDINGAGQLLNNGTVQFQWKGASFQQEKTTEYERQMSNMCFSEGNKFDYISAKNEWTFSQPVQWVSMVQQFFNVTLINQQSFKGGTIKWERKTDSSRHLADADVVLQTNPSANTSLSLPMRLYYGPNDFYILEKEAPEMEKIVNLGRDMYSFVRPINKYIIMPVFNFFSGWVSNYGWVVLLLTLFIRLVTSPLTYSSYLSGAKMKVLRPELDVLKKKFGEDQQGFAMEQMKLFREAGVNPLGGCIPALLQIPIFFALYSFFNSHIALRGQSFLWTNDLSSYDSILTLPFSIPAYGAHVSLFTITAVLTSFLISIYNMAMTPTQDNPALKYMPYIFPFMLLFIFNKLPSALTWYYTVSNIITLGLQFVIQHYIINHDKILAEIEVKRKTPKKKSKFQERYEQMMESQKKLQDLKTKTEGKKK
ncbi:MAG: membrane protein insertase YidC [Sediminibacterium sp.]|jgi:YidC/Oxa1 family membrane protein insertase|nr:membrane protein insertase YidC [Chitinophagaceae bacterium]MCA6473881.1 membrane protein insertase YidC [Chitinophagaceae bacterium]MCA6491407.1 membrane protein insertase YidC [Chitinophagaceae bacterium]MCA6511259.1 membrane protein insertase YidC [Chitinophagaceae bacterium]